VSHVALTTSGSIEPQRNPQANADAAAVYGQPANATRMNREAGTAAVAAAYTSTPTAESSYADGAFTLGEAKTLGGERDAAPVSGAPGFPGDTTWPVGLNQLQLQRERDKIVTTKIRLLDSIGGMFHGMWDVKRGDIVEVDDENALRYVASGLATRNLKDEMPQPFQDTEEAVAIRDEVLKTVAAQCHNPEFDRRPGSEPIGRHPAFPRQRVEGWGI
jgi:hypothetical protein